MGYNELRLTYDGDDGKYSYRVNKWSSPHRRTGEVGRAAQFTSWEPGWLNPPEWQENAACKDMGNDLFYPNKGETQKILAAKKVCAECPVQKECLEMGLEENYGVWGGLTELERKSYRRKHKLRRGETPWAKTLPNKIK